MPYVNGPEWNVFSALTALRPCFSLSAPCASVRVLEPTAKGPETPFLRFPNQRAAGSLAGRPEDPLLEKPQAPRLRAWNREAEACRLGGVGGRRSFPLTRRRARPCPAAPKPAAQGPAAADGTGSRRRDRKP